MAHRIEVSLKPGVTDALGRKTAHRIRTHLGIPIARVETVEVYSVDTDLAADLREAYAAGPLSDPVVQTAAIDGCAALERDFDWLVEVSYRPGVTDNIGRTAREALALMLPAPRDTDSGARKQKTTPTVYSARQFLFKSDTDAKHRLDRKKVEWIAEELLGNSLIQSFRILNRSELIDIGRLPPHLPQVGGAKDTTVETISLERSDEALLALSRQRVLALSLAEMKTLRDYYARTDVQQDRRRQGLGTQATDVELECLAQTWSEHCKHKIFNATIEYTDEHGHTETIHSLFDTYIRGATKAVRALLGENDYCLSVFRDNAGVIRFDEQWNLVFKVETHNSPSALDPYGGALTGIVGVNRDPFGTGMGASLLFNTDVFCLAPPQRRETLPPRLLQPLRVLEGVREGVEHGGNKSGIPTVNGAVVFDERYLGKPLVYCGTGGWMPARVAGRPSYEKAAQPGDRVVMVGGRIGKDGIHGATFSSEALHEGSPATAVQIGDPITQKRMFDMLLLARDKGLYNAITDNGAGGLSSSVGEMAEAPGGATLDLARPPLKYASLRPWEILLSEAQERMTVAVPPEKIDAFMELAARFNVEATDLGTFDDSGYFTLRFGERVVGRLAMDFLHHGLPPLKLRAREKPADRTRDVLKATEKLLPQKEDTLLALLGRLNICSKEHWIRQYDHEVQGGSVVKPLVGAHNDGPADAAVLRPSLDRNRAVVVSCGICPRYSDFDTYHMAACAVDEAVRNAVSVGADPNRLAALDNFCWSDPVESDTNPEGAFKLAQLVRANKALYDICLAYRIPLISGKDSMKNDYRAGDVRISVPPTLLISMLGQMEDAEKAVTSDAKRPGDVVFVLGKTYAELGGSEYLAQHGVRGAGENVPQVRAEANAARYRALHGAIADGLIQSCHDCADGGLGVCLAETALGGDLGMDLDLRAAPMQNVTADAVLLFSETPGRFVITVHTRHAQTVTDRLSGVGLARLGRVTDNGRFTIRGISGQTIIDHTVEQLRTAFKQTLHPDRF
jgi:phosphoribosylformylglycinamidine synthase